MKIRSKSISVKINKEQQLCYCSNLKTVLAKLSVIMEDLQLAAALINALKLSFKGHFHWFMAYYISQTLFTTGNHDGHTIQEHSVVRIHEQLRLCIDLMH